MKQLTLKTFALVSILMAALNAQADKFQAGQYNVDPAHSKVGFEIAHLVISTVEGKFTSFSGVVDLAEKFEGSKVKASVEMKSIDTGVAKRDTHLKSPDFFEVEKHPTMTFESKSIKGNPDSFKMVGDLTIKGIKKQVEFTGKYLGTVADGYGNQKAAFVASTEINRKDFGLSWNNMVEAGPVVGDKVTIELKIQAGRPMPKK